MSAITDVLIKRIRIPAWSSIDAENLLYGADDKDEEWREYRQEHTRLFTNLTLV